MKYLYNSLAACQPGTPKWNFHIFKSTCSINMVSL